MLKLDVTSCLQLPLLWAIQGRCVGLQLTRRARLFGSAFVTDLVLA